MKRLLLYTSFIGMAGLFTTCRSVEQGNHGKLSISLTKEQMLADYHLFQDLFELANPGLYDFHSRETIDSLFVSNEKMIDENTSYREFYNILWNVIDFTGSVHNNLNYPEDVKREIHQQEAFFPLPIKYIDNRLYTNIAGGSIPLASEIISINDVPAGQIFEKASHFRSTDGFNKTGKYASMEASKSAWYIYLALGAQEEFNVKYQSVDEETNEVVLKGVAYDKFQEVFANRHFKKLQEKSTDYSFRFIDSLNTGILAVNTFALGTEEDPRHLKYAHFLDSVFTFLNKNSVANLVVDVRRNGGGNSPNQTLLYSYLTNRSFRMAKSGFAIFNTIPYKEYYKEVYPDELNLLEEWLKEQYSLYQDNKHYLIDKYNPVIAPKANAYQANLYLLISPYVGSAGSLFASMVKSDEKALVVGEETIGGYLGHTGNYTVHYELPHSRLALAFAIVSLKQDVQPLKDQGLGEGIKPHVEVKQSLQDFIKNKDSQLDWVLNYINKKDSE